MTNKEGWKKMKIGEICEIINGFAYDSSLFTDQESGMPLIRIRDVVRGYTKTYYNGKYSENYVVKKGELLIGMDGEFNIGKWNSDNALLNQRVCKLKIDRQFTTDKFIFYFMPKALKNIEEKTPFVTVKHISSKQISNIHIMLPTPPIQQQIVSELDALSDIITKKKQQLADLDKLAQATFYDMFGDPVSNEKGWEIKRLEDLGQWASGGTPSRSVGSYFTGNINWYSAGELNNLFLPPSEEKITETAIKESSAKLFKPNSLFVGMYDTAAFKMGITLTDASSNQACANILPNSSVSIVFLYFMLKEMKEHFLKMRRGIRQQNLNLGMIKKFHIPLPPLYLQTLFVEKTESIEKQKELINKSIADVQQLFDYTMDKYFN
ncbi:MAG: restriction endonuclease subunit S [Paludibacter sp.]|nr:restriction endonuclease subunit S [Paludibacter sp.]